MGEGTWTGDLWEAVGANIPLMVNIDGPYGHPVELSRYETVVFVAGGKAALRHLQEDGIRRRSTTYAVSTYHLSLSRGGHHADPLGPP